MATAIKKFEGTIGSSGGVSTTIYESGLLRDMIYDNSEELNILGLNIDPWNIRWRHDGTKLYFNQSTDRNGLYSLDLTEAWNIASINAESYSTLGDFPTTSTVSFDFGSSGTKLITVETGTTNVNIYTLSTPYDLSTATGSSNSYVQIGTLPKNSVKWNSNGTIFTISLDSNANSVQIVRSNVAGAYALPPSFLANNVFSTGNSIYSAYGNDFWIDNTEGSIHYFAQKNGVYVVSHPRRRANTLFSQTSVENSNELNRVHELNISSSSNSFANISFYGIAEDSANNKIVFYDRTHGFREIKYNNGGYPTTALVETTNSTLDHATSTNSIQTMNQYMKPDGTKFYRSENVTTGSPSGHVLIEYDLANTYDISTASEANRIAWNSIWRAWTFGNDGQYLYRVNYNTAASANTVMNRYTLSTPWDISTATLDTVSLNISAIAGANTSNTHGIMIHPLGTKVVGTSVSSNVGRVYSFKLLTPWDISTANTPRVSGFNNLNEIGNTFVTFSGQSINWFTRDLYGTNSTGDILIYDIDLHAVPGSDVTANATILAPTTITTPHGDFNNTVCGISLSYPDFYEDGKTLITALVLGRPRSYTLNTEAGTADLLVKGSFSQNTAYQNDGVSTYANDLKAFKFNSDGSKLLVGGTTSKKVIYQFTSNTSYNLSTMEYESYLNLNPTVNSAVIDILYNTTDDKLYVLVNTNVYEYSLANTDDINTATFNTTLLHGVSSPTSFTFSNSGENLLISNPNTIFQFNLSTPFDIDSAVLVDSKVANTATGGTIVNIRLNSTGDRLFVLNSLDKLSLFGLAIPNTISTLYFTDDTYTNSQDPLVTSIGFSNTGSITFMGGTDTDKIYKYDSTSLTGSNVNIYTCPANTAAKVMITAQGEFGSIKIDSATIIKFLNKAGIYHVNNSHKTTSANSVVFYPNGVNGVLSNEYNSYFQLAATEILSIQNARNIDYSVYVIEDNSGT